MHLKAHKKKGGNNREKWRRRLAKKHYQVARQREFFHHHMANKLLSENQAETIALEDLHIKGLLKHKKLARHISDVGWYTFANIVAYKASWIGHNVIYSGRFAPTSKQCTCGYKNDNLTLADRIWTCPSCQQQHDRDIFAANNIKKFALADAVGHSQ